MKKLFLLTIVASFMSVTASAQIGESKSKKIETTYTTTTTTVDEPQVVVLPNQNYNRIILGWAPTKFSIDGESETMQGLGFGWIGGYNVTKQRRLPLYLETGLLMNADFGECLSEADKLINFELPINVTYRYNFKNTKIYVAPYFGFHFKVNAVWFDDDGESYFEYEDTNRFQFGMQLGVNFDLKGFHIGFGWDKDFNPIAEVGRENLSTSGARINIGVVF